jgi:hypothetical protein
MVGWFIDYDGILPCHAGIAQESPRSLIVVISENAIVNDLAAPFPFINRLCVFDK